MTSEDALLHTIFDRPNDPYPLLVYADWLEEHGDPRHEVIRIRTALEDNPTDLELTLRGVELVQKVGDPMNGVARFNGELLKCQLAHTGFFRRSLQLTGPLNATVDFSVLGYSMTVRVNGDVAATASKGLSEEQGHIQFFIPHESGDVRAGIFADFGPIRGLEGLLFLLRGVAFYREGKFLKLSDNVYQPIKE
jgi:uncharacterized protein (TIGR02996 family)